jgi:hypothetical protein
MLGTKHDQTGAVLAQDGTDPSANTPRMWPRAQHQPQPLRRAIPTLTGAVLVVNAAWASSSALLRSPAADAARSGVSPQPPLVRPSDCTASPGSPTRRLVVRRMDYAEFAGAGADSRCSGPGHGRAGDLGDGSDAG